ncbi:MAG: hypothetical protein ACRC6T_16255 [Sarcina sp.]
MMINNQPAIIQNTNQNSELKEISNQGIVKNVRVNVVNQLGQLQTTYNISGENSQEVGSKLKNEDQVIQVLNKGIATSIKNLQDSTFANLGSVITVMVQSGMSINSSYTINGQVYPMMANQNDEVTLNSAKIYVPSDILKNNRLTSVEIDGVNFSAKIEGNYVIVNAPIQAISGDSHKVVVNFSNNNKIKSGSLSTTTADVNVIVMNQFGQEILSQDVSNANGYSLASFVANAKSEITNMTYNGNSVTLMDLLDQKYVPNTSNLFVITEFSQAPIEVTATLNGHGQLSLPNQNDSVSIEGAKLEVPSGLARNFKADSVNINGIEYKGHMEGNSYVVNEFIPNAVEYMVKLNLVRK